MWAAGTKPSSSFKLFVQPKDKAGDSRPSACLLLAETNNHTLKLDGGLVLAAHLVNDKCTEDTQPDSPCHTLTGDPFNNNNNNN